MENILDGGEKATKLKHKAMNLITEDSILNTGMKV
jgi:hypothetical protein